jgi:hypothetical protein
VDITKQRTALEKAISNVERAPKVEKDYQEENATLKPMGDKKKQEADAALSKAQELEYHR